MLGSLETVSPNTIAADENSKMLDIILPTKACKLVSFRPELLGRLRVATMCQTLVRIMCRVEFAAVALVLFGMPAIQECALTDMAFELAR